MPRLSIIAATLLLVSASGYRILADGPHPGLLTSPSKPSNNKTLEEIEALNRDIKQKLFALHSYQVIAQKNLEKFDHSLQELDIKDIYKSYTYLNLTAARSQIQKAEDQIQDLHVSYPELIEKNLNEFSKKSPVHQLSYSSINEKLKLSTYGLSATSKEIENEYQRLVATREFHVFEKNIEHLAHLYKAKSKKSSRMPASIADKTESELNSELTIDTLDWLAQSSDKITARTTRIHHHLNRRK